METSPKKLCLVISVALLCSSAAPPPAAAEEWACVEADKCDHGGGVLLYDIECDFSKDGATGGTLQTPMGTYDLQPWYMPGEWGPGGTFRSDHDDLDLPELQAALAPWTVTWIDAASTTATLTFPVPAADDWLAIPEITSPADGATFPVNSTVTMNWTWGGDPADVRCLEAFAADGGWHDEELPTASTSWTTPPLTAGEWELGVDYSPADLGLIVEVTQGTWDTENPDETGLWAWTFDEVVILVPEPAGLALLGLGGLGVLLKRRRG